MMLSTLEDIAAAEGLTFLWGEGSALNKMIDWAETESTVLYHEGYISGSVNIDQQNAFEPGYSLRLALLIQSEFADTPVERRPRFESLEPLMYRVVKRLMPNYTITAFNITEGVIRSNDRNMDGIRFTLTAKVKEPIGVCIK